MILTVAARDSNLSKAQFQEVLKELRQFHPDIQFEPLFVKTYGDQDLKTPLHRVENSDFFTREIDELQLSHTCRLSIHSAKDLPQPLRKGLTIACLTKGVDARDVLVLPQKRTFVELGEKPRIGTSSQRRTELLHTLLPKARLVDIRGTIEHRLELLDSGEVDALVMAEAALIRLQLTHRNRIYLKGTPAPFQGQLAVVCLMDDQEMLDLFKPMDSRRAIE